MKKNNKKGFTLVELLAVIVILAVVVLIAMTAVVPQMAKARKNAFETDLNKFVQGATSYYTESQINGTGMSAGGGCVTVASLVTNGYLTKNDIGKYSGYVRIAVDNNGKASYYVNVSNGLYYTGTTEGTASEISSTTISSNVKEGNAAAPSDLSTVAACNN